MIDHYDGGAAVHQPPQILTREAVCALLHMSPNTWRAFAKRMRVPEAFISSPRRKLYQAAVIQKLLDGSYSPAAAAEPNQPKRRSRAEAAR